MCEKMRNDSRSLSLSLLSLALTTKHEYQTHTQRERKRGRERRVCDYFEGGEFLRIRLEGISKRI
jgi:hypothetical protein